MKELSLNILDIAMNSVKAGATLIELLLEETAETLTVVIRDDGCGMDEGQLARLSDPFFTTRTTRKVGMGVPFYRLAAEQTGGRVTFESTPRGKDPVHHGTTVTALFYKNHIDFTPLGNIIDTICTLVHGSPERDFVFRHRLDGGGCVELDTRVLRETLGAEIPLSSFEVLEWIRAFLAEQYEEQRQA